jgi:hypothetical protein
MQSNPSHNNSTSTSYVIDISGPAEERSNRQHSNRQLAEPPTKLSLPTQAATPAGSVSAACLHMQPCSNPTAAAECYICLLAGSAAQELIQPCACAGTMGYAHAACLAASMQKSGSLTCECCKQQYQQQYVQALGLAAAADKPEHKDRTAPAADTADDTNCNTYQPWLSLRCWLL